MGVCGWRQLISQLQRELKHRAADIWISSWESYHLTLSADGFARGGGEGSRAKRWGGAYGRTGCVPAGPDVDLRGQRPRVGAR